MISDLHFDQELETLRANDLETKTSRSATESGRPSALDQGSAVLSDLTVIQHRMLLNKQNKCEHQMMPVEGNSWLLGCRTLLS